jgi:hypothetical protein
MTDTDPRGLWPNLHVTRTVSGGTIVPLSDAFEYGGYYLLGSSISDNATIIQYQYSDPVDLSDIENFRILYDSNVNIQFTITLRDNNSNQVTYSSPASNTGFNYEPIFSRPNFSSINPLFVTLTTSSPSASVLSSVREISVDVSPSGPSIPVNSLVIYAITTGYDLSKYSNLNSGFRDVFLLPQRGDRINPSFFSPPPNFPQPYQYLTSNLYLISSTERTIVPLPNARGLSGTLGSVENYLPSFFVPGGGTTQYTAGCLAAVNKGLCVFGKSNSPTTVTVTYFFPSSTTLSSDKKVNLQLAYYTQNGVDNDPGSRFTLKVQLSNSDSSSGVSPLTILNTALPITQSLSYRYFFTDAEFLPIPPGGANYNTLTITIGNVKSFSTNRFVATPTASSVTFLFPSFGGSITFSSSIQSTLVGGNEYYFLPKGSTITFNILPSSSIALTVLYDTIFTKVGGTVSSISNTITFNIGNSIFFPYGLAFSGPIPPVAGNFDISPLPSFLALEYIAINFKRYNMAQLIPQFP